MPAPLVSVCIPTCNVAKLIARTLATVLGQTHANIEVISVREGKVLLSWLLVRLGLTPLRPLLQPLLSKSTRQTA